ncbi:MAG: methyl-accepting chemotaxis protein, partial [Candidatus Promineifilaceae bacterium]
MTTRAPSKLTVNRTSRSLREQIQVRLLFSLLVLVALAVLVGYLSVQAQNESRQETEALITANNLISTAELDLAGSIAEVERLTQNYVLVSADPTRLREAEQLYFSTWETEIIKINSLLNELEAGGFNPTTLNSVDGQLQTQVSAMQEVRDLSEDRANALMALLDNNTIESAIVDIGVQKYELTILNLIQLEKAFIVTAQEVFANDLRDGEAIERQFRALATDTRVEIEADEALSEEFKTAFLPDFDTYVATFNLLADSDRSRRLKTFEVESATGPLKTLIGLEVSNLKRAQEGQETALGLLSQAALTRLLPLIVLSVLVAALLAGILISGVSQQIQKFQSTVKAINDDDFDARVEIVSRDEIGVMAQEFNTLLDNTVSLIQSRDEKERIQTAVMTLLMEVSDVAEGDLTITAQVNDDITGSIANSFNFMIAQLRGIIVQVQATANRVSISSNRIQTTAEYLADGSATQSDQILNTSAAIDEMSISIQQVSENSAKSAIVSDQARINAHEGSRAVHDTIGSMNRIRTQIESVADNVNELRDYSEQIGEIVLIVSDLADRTSVLAINATIRAMAAGKVGRGFAVVAREVEALAAETTSATERVDSIIRMIQRDTIKT